MTIRETIVKEFKDRGMKQSELAELTGLTKSQISNYFNGKSQLTDSSIDKLFEALNIESVKRYS